MCGGLFRPFSLKTEHNWVCLEFPQEETAPLLRAPSGSWCRKSAAIWAAFSSELSAQLLLRSPWRGGRKRRWFCRCWNQEKEVLISRRWGQCHLLREGAGERWVEVRKEEEGPRKHGLETPAQGCWWGKREAHVSLPAPPAPPQVRASPRLKP